jgi:hypothetical protein
MTYAPAAEVWNISPVRWDLARENEMSRRIYGILLRWIPFANEQFREWEGRPDCGHFFGGSFWYQSDSASNAVIFAALSKLGEYDESETGIPRDVLKRRAIQAIRYIGFTHDTGPEDCVRVEGVLPYTSGKKWGGEGDNFFMASQNGRSVAYFAYASWLLWDDLDDETRMLVQNVAASYADRWSADEPRNGVYYDTQCEENAWTSAGIGAALSLFPDHPHREQWRSGFMNWSVNAVTTVQDRLADPSGLIDNPSGNRVRTVTFHPDYTAENHAFVHPSYLCAGTNLRGIYALMAITAGREILPTALHNNVNLYERMVKIWAQFDGLCIPVQGQDWWYNRQHERQLTHAILNVVHGNRDAACHERGALDSIERLQRSNSRGCLLEERGEECVINKAHAQYAKDLEHGSAVDLLLSYLLHLFGGAGAEPSDPAEMAERLSGVYKYPYGNSIVHRRSDSFSSFTWRNNVMALTLPSRGLWNVTPLYASYTGTMEIEGTLGVKGLTNETIIRSVLRENIQSFRDGFAATVTIGRGAPELLQHAAFLSLPSGATVYVERMEAVRDCSVRNAVTGIVGIRNEHYSGMPELAPGSRTLYRADGQDTFRGFYGSEPNEVRCYEPQAYVNVDDFIGYIAFGSNGMKYVNKHEYPKWKGVEDILVLNDMGSFDMRAGESRKPFVVVSLPNRTAGQTAEASRATRLLETSDDCLVMESEDVMIAVNFADVPVRTAADKRIGADGAVNLYEGRQTIRNGSYTWICPAPAFSSLYRTAVCVLHMAADQASELDITVADNRAVVTNGGTSAAELAFRLASGVERRMTVEAGATAVAELG